MIDRTTYTATVYDYQSGDPLEGEATESLISESLRTEAGAVHATREERNGRIVWDDVRSDEVDAARRRGEHVDVVYVTDITARVDARRLEDADDCLAAAIEHVREFLALDELSADARWEDERTRDAVIVEVRS